MPRPRLAFCSHTYGCFVSAPGAENDAKFVTRLQCGVEGELLRHFKVYDADDEVKMYENTSAVVTAMTLPSSDSDIIVYESSLSSTDFRRLRADEARGWQPQNV